MRRAFAAAVAVASIWGTAAALVPAAAVAAPTSRGTLTSLEYRELTNQYLAVKAATSGKKINWQKALAACRKAGTTDPLLSSQRNSCIDQLTTVKDLVVFGVDEPKCIASSGLTTTTGTTTSPTTTPGTTTTGTTTTGTTTTGTTTTGTTTTPALTGAEAKFVICLNPDYQALGKAVTAMYPADVTARKRAVARHFTGRCLATLVPTSEDLKHEESFAFTTKHLAVDDALLTKVSRGQAPPTVINAVQLVDDVRAFESAAAQYLNEKSPQILSVCPHQS